MSEKMTIGRTGLVPAERECRRTGQGEKVWFYVGRGKCEFLAESPTGQIVEVVVSTKRLQRALCRMELELGQQRKLRREATKGKRR